MKFFSRNKKGNTSSTQQSSTSSGASGSIKIATVGTAAPTARRSSNYSSGASVVSQGSGGNAASQTPVMTAPMQPSTQPMVPEAVKGQMLQAVQQDNQALVARILREHPNAARTLYVKGKAAESLLSMALMSLASLKTIQTIYNANPDAIAQGNSHGMSPMHQATTVATPLDILLYLVTTLKTNHKVSIGQLVAPGKWSVLHIACRCGTLPPDAFQYVLNQARTNLAVKTSDKGSTPLHLAIFGLGNRSTADQRIMLQTLIQAYPYAANTKNASGFTPVDLAQHQASKGHLPSDMVGLLMDVQVLVKRKYGTRVLIEQAIVRCRAKLDAVGATAPQNAEVDVFNSMSSNNSGGSGNMPRIVQGNDSIELFDPKMSKATSADKRERLRQGMLGHIEMQMLLPLRRKFPSEQELRQLIEIKTRERNASQNKGPAYLAHTEALNNELIQLENKLQRELDALVPQEIQATRAALFERLQAQTHLLPINNVSIEWIKYCTDDFSENNKIGKGGFGAVYRAYDDAKCTQYAVKKTEKVNDPSLLREVEVLAQVFHPNVVNLLGFYVPPNGRAPEFLVYEYAAGGTVADRCSSEENRRSYAWNFRLSTAVGVASGLNYLHHGMHNKIYHHDIKPENVCLTETLDRAILIDCGISKVLKGGQASTFKMTMAGTPFYLPPDYSEETPYDEKCEVYSFGMVLRVALSGALPKSLADRETPLVADTLAGKWPGQVLPKIMDLTNKCVSKFAKDRPTVAGLYEELTKLEKEADEKLELTVQQEETINETLRQSRAASRQSRKLEAFGQCFCSRKKKKGLYCPGKKHFQCTECFNKYVLDCLGEDIFCREVCHCKDAYTLDELHHHLRRSVLCRHVEALMRNQELMAYKKANSRMTDEIGKGFERVMNGITSLARNELKCPMLAILIPARSDCRNKSLMKRAMRSWKNSTTKTFFLYFLCAYDKSLVQPPIRIDARRDWIKRAAPFLRAALMGLQIALAMGTAIKFDLEIPMLDFRGDGRSRQDKLTENLTVLDQMVVDAAGEDRNRMDRDAQQVLQAMNAGANGGRISSESYRMIAEFANEPGNTGWKDRMVLQERQGELAWVRKENESRWKHGTR